MVHRFATTRSPRTLALLASGVVAATALFGCSSDTDTATPTPSTEANAAATDASTDDSTTTSAGSPNTAGPETAPTRPWVIAHRGASGLAPEHTFASYDLAQRLGADYIELDLQFSSDGELVVLHDPGLNRTTRGQEANCAGRVDEKTIAAIKTCNAGSWFNEAHPSIADPDHNNLTVPTFAEVLHRYGHKVRYYIETKKTLPSEGLEAAMIDALEAAGFTSDAPTSAQIIIQSFDPASLAEVGNLRPDLTLVRLFSAQDTPLDVALLDEAATIAAGIGPSVSNVDAALIAAAHERCLMVHPYTVDDPAVMTELLDLGVDGIFTNRPDVMLPLAKGRSWTPPC